MKTAIELSVVEWHILLRILEFQTSIVNLDQSNAKLIHARIVEELSK